MRSVGRMAVLLVLCAVPGGGVRGDYYDSEGHVIRYVVRSPAAGQAVLLSEAPPDAPAAFKPYLTWESRRTTTPGP